MRGESVQLRKQIILENKWIAKCNNLFMLPSNLLYYDLRWDGNPVNVIAAICIDAIISYVFIVFGINNFVEINIVYQRK